MRSAVLLVEHGLANGSLDGLRDRFPARRPPDRFAQTQGRGFSPCEGEMTSAPSDGSGEMEGDCVEAFGGRTPGLGDSGRGRTGGGVVASRRGNGDSGNFDGDAVYHRENDRRELFSGEQGGDDTIFDEDDNDNNNNIECHAPTTADGQNRRSFERKANDRDGQSSSETRAYHRHASDGRDSLGQGKQQRQQHLHSSYNRANRNNRNSSQTHQEFVAGPAGAGRDAEGLWGRRVSDESDRNAAQYAAAVHFLVDVSVRNTYLAKPAFVLYVPFLVVFILNYLFCSCDGNEKESIKTIFYRLIVNIFSASAC